MPEPAISNSPEVLSESSQIGPYRVVRKLGQGGMGVVYEAQHTELGRRVAIKVLRAELAADPELAARFGQEARTVNRVDHPGVVQVVDLGAIPGGPPYIVMEFLRGQTLADRVRERGDTLPWPEAANFVLQVAEILLVAHQAGIVHRDLKPENVMLIPDSQLPLGQRVKLLDFGIAKVLDEANANHFKTKTGALMGSPAYMSPEQCKGSEPVTVRADIYALGVMFYEILAGSLPHVAEGPGHMVVLHMFGTPRPLRELRRGLPEAVYALVDRMLQKAPTDRPSIAELVRALQQLQQPTRTAGAGGRYALGAVLVLLIVLLTVSAVGKVRTGRFPWQPPPPVTTAGAGGLGPAQAPVLPAAPAAPIPTPAKSDQRPPAKAAPPRPISSPPRSPSTPPADELNFVPVDVPKRKGSEPLPMQPVR